MEAILFPLFSCMPQDWATVKCNKYSSNENELAMVRVDLVFIILCRNKVCCLGA